jgi:nicotinamide phosphoribosyltransferase
MFFNQEQIGKTLTKTFNLPAHTDSYKAGHNIFYPKDLRAVTSYLESRGGAYEKTLFYGCINYYANLFSGTVVTKAGIQKAEHRWVNHFGRKGYFNPKDWEYIVEKYDGKLPVRIKTVKEGTIVPTGNALVIVESTDDKCGWLVGVLETMLLRMWYPITIATQGYYLQKELRELHKQTMVDDVYSDPLFSVHDFGMRGITSDEQGEFGGSAHLLCFRGSDTSNAIDFIEEYYWPSVMPAYSVPATEHSVMCSFGGKNFEIEATRNALEVVSEGIVSIVGDTWNIWNFADNIIGEVLHDLVLSRNGKTVIRPDSFDPILINCGYKKYPLLKEDMGTFDISDAIEKGYKCSLDGYEILPTGVDAEHEIYYGVFGEKLNPLKQKGLLNILWDRFGGHINKKGFKVLNPKVGLIQGDGMNPTTIVQLFKAVIEAGFCCSNIVTGSGGGLLMNCNRDTLKFAFKASAVNRNGVWIDIQKDPITSSGKKSKKGHLKLVKDDVLGYKTMSSCDMSKEEFDNAKCELVTVLENGMIYNLSTWDDIIGRINF